MPTLDELRQRYGGYSINELGDLIRSELTPDARLALSGELERRNLSLADFPAPDGTSSQRTFRHRGWITVFQLWVIFVLGAFAFRTLPVLISTISAGWIFRESFALVAFVAMLIYGLVLVARRSRFARQFWLALLGPWTLLVLVGPLFSGGHRAATLAQLVLVAAWFLYWWRSERVRQEFRVAQSRSPAG
jgi:RsiW-degrading membrane proteinase PrsW (M82 family)